MSGTLSLGSDFLDSSIRLQEFDFLKAQDPSLVLSFQRTAISRAYYGVFHLAKDLAYKCEKRFNDDDTIHGELRKFYLDMSKCEISKKEEQIQEKLEYVGVSLDQLRKIRNSCDYDKYLDFTLDSKIRDVLSIAKKTRETIDELHIWVDMKLMNNH